MNNLVAIYSPYPQSGKSTFATALSQAVPGSRVIKFADAMRRVVVPFVAPFVKGGVAEVSAWLNDERKDKEIIPELGVTLRHCLQTLGSGWGRHMIHPDLWVMIVRKDIQAARKEGVPLIIVDDLRMPNEYRMLAREYAHLIRVFRRDPPATPPHESNAQLEDFSFHEQVLSVSVEQLTENARAFARERRIHGAT